MQLNNIFLTIGIPTYNRKDLLLELLGDISKTNPPVLRCEILIINNGDDLLIDDELTKLLSDKFVLRVIENNENCGGQENVLRVYENSCAEYVWVLGDDDRLAANAVHIIIETLVKENVEVLHFCSDSNSHPLIDTGNKNFNFLELFSGSFPLRRLMFAPLFVLRRSILVPYFAIARLTFKCFTPQLALMILSEPKSIYYLDKTIILSSSLPVTRNQRLSILPVFLGIFNLPNVSTNCEYRTALKILLKKEWNFYLKPTKIIGSLAIKKISGKSIFFKDYIFPGIFSYPIWIVPFFLAALYIVKILPCNILNKLLQFYLISEKGVKADLSDFYSEDRV